MDKNILFPTDFSDPSKFAFVHALKIAKQLNGEIHVLHVVIPEVEALDVPVISEKVTNKRVMAAEEVLGSFIEYGKSLIKKKVNLKITSSVEVGFPAKTILKYAREKSSDLIVMACRGEYGTLDKIFGSISSSVAIKASCPVLLIPEGSEFEEISDILYATDYQETDPYHIMRLINLIDPFTKSVRCVHVKRHSDDKKRPLEIKALKEVFEKHNPSVEMTFHEWESESLMRGIMEFADIYEVDMIAVLVQKKT